MKRTLLRVKAAVEFLKHPQKISLTAKNAQEHAGGRSLEGLPTQRLHVQDLLGHPPFLLDFMKRNGRREPRLLDVEQPVFPGFERPCRQDSVAG